MIGISKNGSNVSGPNVLTIDSPNVTSSTEQTREGTVIQSTQKIKESQNQFSLLPQDIHWKAPVLSHDTLPTSGNVINDARVVENAGNPIIYICIATSGTIDEQWSSLAGLSTAQVNALIEGTDHVITSLYTFTSAIAGVAPSLSTQLTTKGYVDSLVASASGAINEHNELQSIQGGDSTNRWHLTLGQYNQAIQTATSSVTGLLSPTDWATFNNKAPALGSDDNYVTDAQLVVISNTSGTNTGDNATNSQYSGLAASKQDTLVSGTNIKTINSVSLLGSGDIAVQAVLGFTPEDVANKSTNVSTDGSSDTKYPSVKSIKDYTDSLIVGLLDYRGGYDASVNTWPVTGGSGTAGAVLKGDMWVISVQGTLGGNTVHVGDSIAANADTPGQTAGNWNTFNANITYVPEDQANKVTSISGASTDTQYPSAKLLYDQLALKAAVLTSDENYVTDAQLVVITNTSGTNTGDNSANTSRWGITGNSGLIAGTNFIGTTDAVDLVFKRNSVLAGLIGLGNGGSTYFGLGAGNLTDAGYYNTGIGTYALNKTETGSQNVAIGGFSMFNKTGGDYNTAIGYTSLQNNITGSSNVAVGAAALYENVVGNGNTAFGHSSLYTTLGSGNVALGKYAGQHATGDDKFFIDNQDRTDAAGEIVSSLLYGTFSVAPSGQTLVTNAAFTATYGMNIPTGQTYKINNVSITSTLWGITGNSGLTAGTNFIGTTDDVDIVFKRNNAQIGLLRGSNVVFGLAAINNYTDYDGTFSTMLGAYAGYSSTHADNNVFLGSLAGYTNITGDRNVFLGSYAGMYLNGSDKFVVNNRDQSTSAADLTNSLLYGVFDATPSNQTLLANAAFTATYGMNIPTGQTYKVNGVPIGGSGGITRSVNSISAPDTAGSTALTDYVYLITGTTTLTMPTAVGNTNRYTVKNVGVATVTIAPAGAETLDGSATISLPVQFTSVDLISDGANWNVI